MEDDEEEWKETMRKSRTKLSSRSTMRKCRRGAMRRSRRSMMRSWRRSKTMARRSKWSLVVGT